VPEGSLSTASAEQILPRDSVQRNCFKRAFIHHSRSWLHLRSHRFGYSKRPRCRCRLATFGALPAPSTIYREIIMLNNHRFWGHASGPSSSSGKTHSSFHPLLARPCRGALPRERFSPLTHLRHWPRPAKVLLIPVWPLSKHVFEPLRCHLLSLAGGHAAP